MSKLKIAELVVLSATAIFSAAKAILKFIGYMGKLKKAKLKPKHNLCFN